MRGKEILSELSPYQQGKQTSEIMEQYGLDKIVKLASNENPFGFSKRVTEELQAINHIEIYPDGYTGVLRSKIANKLNVKETQLAFGGGSDELIQILCRTFLYDGAGTVMAKPTFTQYKHHALIEGANIKEIDAINGEHDLNKMLEAIDEETKVVWICSPDNPSGAYIQEDQFKNFMEKCPSDVLVVLDEAYIEFVREEIKFDSLDYINKYSNLLLLRTFSKAYGLAGIRVGYAIGHEDIIRNIDIVRGPFNTTSISQRLATVAIDDDQFIEETVSKNLENRTRFEQFLDEIGWEYYPSETNFLLVKTPAAGTDLFEYLLENGYIVRPGELLGYPNTVRITIGEKEDMDILEKVIIAYDQKFNK